MERLWLRLKAFAIELWEETTRLPCGLMETRTGKSKMSFVSIGKFRTAVELRKAAATLRQQAEAMLDEADKLIAEADIKDDHSSRLAAYHIGQLGMGTPKRKNKK